MKILGAVVITSTCEITKALAWSPVSIIKYAATELQFNVKMETLPMTGQESDY